MGCGRFRASTAGYENQNQGKQRQAEENIESFHGTSFTTSRVFRFRLTQQLFLGSAGLVYPPAPLRNSQPRKNATSTASAMPIPISHLVLTLIINLAPPGWWRPAAFCLGITFGYSSGGGVRHAGWTGLCPGTHALSTYHDVVPTADGFPLIPQEIALCLAFAALDDVMVATDGAIT